jgi:hypothetical protein
MLSLLLHLAFSENLYGIDLGTQYLKTAQLGVSSIEMVIHPKTGVLFPTSVALKSTKPLNFPLQAEDFNYTRLAVGSNALTVLRRYPQHGYEFLPRAIARARASSDFTTPEISNTTAVFALFLSQYFTHSLPETDGFVVVVPAFWVAAQRSVVSRAIKAFRLPVIAVVDEVVAVSNLYTAEKGGQLLTRSVHILFVDIGATSIKAYGVRFVGHPTGFEANETAYFWSESAGSYFFAKAIAIQKGIPIRKAQKLLIRSEDGGLAAMYAGELEELEQIVRRAMIRAVRVGGPIDEVQLIGGASTIRAVADRIRAVASDLPVKRDMKEREALARGGLLVALRAREMNPNLPVAVGQRAPWSVNFTCRGSHVYCRRGEFCESEIAEGSTGCQRPSFTADPSEIPGGLSPRLVDFRLRNLTGTRTGESTGHFEFSPPDLAIAAVRWCTAGACAPVEFELAESYTDEALESAKLIEPIIAREKAEDAREAQRHAALREIGALLAALGAVVEGDGSAAVERGRPVTESQRGVYRLHADAFEAGEYRRLEQDALAPVVIALRALKAEVLG